ATLSYQETTALEQLEQVRVTSKYLDTYTSDLAKAVNQLSKEVRSLEEVTRHQELLLTLWTMRRVKERAKPCCSLRKTRL
ncbi:hypothetical protein SPRG_21002, partial [Saprolegnia parasitica CBS 223.65]